jgi:hypothetical protein
MPPQTIAEYADRDFLRALIAEIGAHGFTDFSLLGDELNIRSGAVAKKVKEWHEAKVPGHDKLISSWTVQEGMMHSYKFIRRALQGDLYRLGATWHINGVGVAMYQLHIEPDLHAHFMQKFDNREQRRIHELAQIFVTTRVSEKAKHETGYIDPDGKYHDPNQE